MEEMEEMEEMGGNGGNGDAIFDQNVSWNSGKVRICVTKKIRTELWGRLQPVNPVNSGRAKTGVGICWNVAIFFHPVLAIRGDMFFQQSGILG
jgi:hypothetical protein